MKLDINNYKEDILYNKSITKEVEQDIFDLMEKSNGTDYDSSFDGNTSNLIVNNLSDIRNNILDWYPLEETANVLEIGTEYGIITEMLAKKVSKVVSIDFSKQRAIKVADKLKDYNNIEIKVGHLSKLNIEEKFDYITLIGTLSYYRRIFNGNINEFFEYLRGLLSENGKILMATENKFGVKYLVGSLNEYTNSCFNTFSFKNESDGDITEANIIRFTKKMIEDALISVKMNNYKFYYPLPDYKVTNVIFSDNYMPTISTSKLTYNSSHLRGSNIIANELELLHSFIEDGKFADFTNSFFVEVSNIKNSDKIEKLDLPRFVSYNNARKKEYRLLTKMYDTYIEKSPQFIDATTHLENIKYNINLLKKCEINTPDFIYENSVRSDFLNYPSLDMILNNKSTQEQMYTTIKNWSDFLANKLEVNSNLEDIKNENIFKELGVQVEDTVLEKLTILKKGFIDMVFENIFVDKDDFYIYDQEWYFENSPLEYIIYRALRNLYSYSRKPSATKDFNGFIEKFDILQYIELFDKLENKLQKYVLDKKRLELSSKVDSGHINVSELKQYVSNLEKRTNELVIDIDNYVIKNNENIKSNDLLNKKIEEKDETISKLDSKLNNIYNSKGWKLLENIRKLKPKVKEKEKIDGDI